MSVDFFWQETLTINVLWKYDLFPGAKVRCLHDYAKPIMRDFNPNQLILNVGTNDLNSENANSKDDNNDITISLIASRADNLNNKVNEVNNRLVNMSN